MHGILGNNQELLGVLSLKLIYPPEEAPDLHGHMHGSTSQGCLSPLSVFFGFEMQQFTRLVLPYPERK
jgi:hypothetical protein